MSPIWNVSSESEVRLADWSVRRVEDDPPTCHLVGYNTGEGEGRVSSAIVEFQAVEQIATTRSGRRYRLLGRSGGNSDAEYVWNRWCAIHAVTQWTDITADFAEAPERFGVSVPVTAKR